MFTLQQDGSHEERVKVSHIEQSGGSKKENEINTVGRESDIRVICDDSCINLMCQESSWVFDSEASFQVTLQSNFFCRNSTSDFGSVKMGNSCASKIAGIRDICLEINQGLKLVFKDVRYALNIHLNLISIERLDDELFVSWFG